jgi:hypothetical protein
MSYFIKQFAEVGSSTAMCNPAALGTATVTKSIEGSDQDNNSVLLNASMGTKICTATIEGMDQDAHGGRLFESGINAFGTGTATESIESLDQDKANNFFEA